jgi:hypothetical protein
MSKLLDWRRGEEKEEEEKGTGDKRKKMLSEIA